MQAIFSDKILHQESCMQKMKKMLEAQFQFTKRKILQKETKRNVVPAHTVITRSRHRTVVDGVAIYCDTLWIASQAIKTGRIAMTKRHAAAITSPSLREKRSFSWQSITLRYGLLPKR